MQSDDSQRDGTLELEAIKWRKSLAFAFKFASAGAVRSLRLQRNLRIHFVAGALVLLWNLCVRPPLTVVTVSILTIAFVMSIELFNSALEHLTDLASEGMYSEFAKWAKDAAAGAVLMSGFGALAVGVWLVDAARPWKFLLFSTTHLFGAVESLIALCCLLFWGAFTALQAHS